MAIEFLYLSRADVESVGMPMLPLSTRSLAVPPVRIIYHLRQRLKRGIGQIRSPQFEGRICAEVQIACAKCVGQRARTKAQ